MDKTWFLTLRSPWNQPREHDLPAGRTTIGRRSDSDIVISDDSASRLHAEIVLDAETGTLTLSDLGSTNGTYVNRERISRRVQLRPKDQIRIGHHELSLAAHTGPREAVGERLPATQPVTPDLVLQAVDQNAVVLYEVGKRLNTIVDLQVALEETSRLARVALGADACALIPAHRFDHIDELNYPASIAHQAIELRSAVFVPDYSAEAAAPMPHSALLLHIRSVLCVPGLVDDQVVVLTYAYRSGAAARPFDHRDLQLAVAISSHAALTIQRAELLARAYSLEQLAITDPLTGIHNRRHFFEFGPHEFNRAQRYRRPLAALMLDIDDFKRINDTFGHAAGDRAMRLVANSLRDTLRRPNLLARYGGDEFVVLLPECNEVGAQHAAERLRRHVAELEFTTEAGPQPLALSTGWATLSEAYDSLPALINAADAALLASKQGKAQPQADGQGN